MQPVPYSNVAWSLLPLNKGSGEQESQGWAPTPGLPASSFPSLQTGAPGTVGTYPAPSSFPKLPGTWNLHTEVPSTRDHLWYNKQERDCIEKTGQPREHSKSCGITEVRAQKASSRSTSKGWAGPLSRCSWLPIRSPKAYPPIRGSHQDPLSHLQAPVPSPQRCSSWSDHLLPPTSLQFHLAHRLQRASFCMGYLPEAGRDSSLV